MAVPRVVLTLGVHGSASTWTFNVARELLQAALGAEAVAAYYANNANELLAERSALRRHLVCKVHSWPGLEVFAYLTGASVILTVRDPRDAVVSLIRRFGTPFDISWRGIANDCRQAGWAAAAGHPILRYEDRFYEAPGAVELLARHLGVPVRVEDAARIFAAYRTDAVRDFATTVERLPPERLSSDGKAMVFDRVTQIHRTHIGDGRVGKWRELLDAAQQRELTRFFAPFLKRFGYPLE